MFPSQFDSWTCVPYGMRADNKGKTPRRSMRRSMRAGEYACVLAERESRGIPIERARVSRVRLWSRDRHYYKSDLRTVVAKPEQGPRSSH